MTVNILTALSIFILFWAVNANNISLLTTENSSRVSYIEDVLKANMFSSLANEVILTSQFPGTVEVLKETFRKNDYSSRRPVGYSNYDDNIKIINNIKTTRGKYYVKFEGNNALKLTPEVETLNTQDSDNIFENWTIQDSLDINADNGYLRIGTKLILTNPIYKKYRVVSHFNGKLYFIGFDGYNNTENTFFATDLSNAHNDDVNNPIILGETVNLNFEPHFIGLDQFNGNIFISSKYEIFILEKLHYYKDLNGLVKPYFQNPENAQLEKALLENKPYFVPNLKSHEEEFSTPSSEIYEY